MTASSLFFDQQDHELLLMVNRILERDRHKGRESLFFAAELAAVLGRISMLLRARGEK